MIPNEEPTSLSWWWSSRLRPKYDLNDFGKAEYIDQVVPVQILLVMMGFTIALLSSLNINDPMGKFNANTLITGVAYLIAYMFYLTEYYEKLWEPYFLLPEDKLFFRLYSLFVGFIVIVLMAKWPEYWSAYVLTLFLVMFIKKRSTKKHFHAAVNARYGEYHKCSDPKIRSLYVLVDTFTWNFLYLGIYVLAVPAAIMCASGFLVKNPESMAWLQIRMPSLTLSNIEMTYYITSALTSGGTILFWAGKITSGLRKMKSQIEEGFYAYFEVRDFYSRIRRGRYAP